MHWAFTLESIVPCLCHEIVLPSLHLCPLGIFKALRDIWQPQLLIKAVVLLLEITEKECLRLLFSAPSGFPLLQLHGAAH